MHKETIRINIKRSLILYQWCSKMFSASYLILCVFKPLFHTVIWISNTNPLNASTSPLIVSTNTLIAVNKNKK